MYYWDKVNLEKMVPKMAQGADLPNFSNHDTQNKEAMKYIADFSDEEVVDNFIAARKDICASLSNIDENVRFTIGGKKRQFSVDSFVKIFIKHDIHHLKQINDKLNR